MEKRRAILVEGHSYDDDVSTNVNTTSIDHFLSRRSTGDGSFNGWLDDLRLYSRVLTAAEIGILYNDR